MQQISLYTDVHLDDSYTPSKVTISAGSFHHDLQVIRTVDLDQPRGWQHFKLGSGEDEADDPDDPSRDEDERCGQRLDVTGRSLTRFAVSSSGSPSRLTCSKLRFWPIT